MRLFRRFRGSSETIPVRYGAVLGVLALALAVLLPSCQGPGNDPSDEAAVEGPLSVDFAYEEDDLIPGETLLARLGHISQLDRLDDTEADYARCSTAATLNAYLLLGGDFASAAGGLGVDTAFSFANVHRVQETLYHLANADGEPGIYGTARPEYDPEGQLVGVLDRDEFGELDTSCLGLTPLPVSERAGIVFGSVE